ncbi:uncharacterized protein LOC133191160 [Saccostrea echinata]|uniref:uncharacterized protein LOC133191160 n=1 Tax=Saccostrea echinata TaxID=191078 RepID=UPI002A826A42|nr:uncharacterized protein LOC133191160 [Saccostrea echinata]
MSDSSAEPWTLDSSKQNLSTTSTTSFLTSTLTKVVSQTTKLITNDSSTASIPGITTESLQTSTPWIASQKTPHPLTGKDHTVLVTLIVMGIIVPSVFVFVIVSICYRQKKMVRQRREQMLLRNQQDFAMDELPYSMRATLASGKL